MATWADPDSAVSLEKLKAALGDGGYAFTLLTGGRHPHLHVTNRDAAQLTEDIYCDGRYYWWSWGERIAPVADVAAAAQAVRQVLRSLTGAGR